MLAFIFPGQGSQAVGMGRALADAFPDAAATFAEADAAFAAASPDGESRRLSEIIVDGPESELTRTEHAQPALLTVSTAACRVLARHGIAPAIVAGHSLGEYSAHVAAGTFTFSDAVGIVRKRGRYMQEAAPVGQGAMAAILGADLALVTQACTEAAEGEVVAPANINGGGQIVIAGTAAAVARAADRARALGARRAVPLAVSAPFHCAMMAPAEARLAPELRALPASRPRVPVVANVDGEPRLDAEGAIEALVRQVAAPVRWDLVVSRMARDGVTTYIEVGPGAVLSGLVRKIHSGARTLQFGTPADLEAIVSTCSISAEK